MSTSSRRGLALVTGSSQAKPTSRKSRKKKGGTSRPRTRSEIVEKKTPAHVTVRVTGTLGEPDIDVTVKPRPLRANKKLIPWSSDMGGPKPGYLRKYVIDYGGDAALSPFAIQNAIHDAVKEILAEAAAEMGELRAKEQAVRLCIEEDV